MRHRILAWVASLVGGTILLALVSLLVITRSAAKDADVGSPQGVDTLPPAGLPGTTDAPAPKRDTTVASQPAKNAAWIFPNNGPIDSTLLGLERGSRQRAALDVVLRKGIFYQVKELKPDLMRVVVGASFFSEPTKYRNPLLRDLYHAYNDGRPKNRPYCIELWGSRAKFGEYVSDTFYTGPGYDKPR